MPVEPIRYERQALFWLVDTPYRMMSRSTDFVCPDLYIQRRFLRITDVNRGCADPYKQVGNGVVNTAIKGGDGVAKSNP